MGSRKGSTNKAKKAVEMLKSGKVKTKTDAMKLSGYKASSIAACTVGRTKEYKDYLATIDDTAITDRWQEWALEDNPKDKRLALDAGKELVKIKDRNPLNIVDKTGLMPILNMVFEGDVTVRGKHDTPDVDYEVE